MLVCASSNQSLLGRVVSTRNGGVLVQVGNLPVSPNMIGLGPTVSLDALSLSVGPVHPVLRALPAQGSASAGGAGLLRIDGLLPGDVLQLVVTEPVLSGPPALPAVALTGFGAIYPDPQHPMWSVSLALPAWQLVASISGEASFTFDYQGLTPGLQVMAQAILVPGLVLTNPVAVAVLP